MLFYNVITKIFKIYTKTFYKVEIKGLENLPEEGPYIIACNHKSNLDAIFVSGLINHKKLRCVSKKELFNNKILAFILDKLGVIPINRDNPDISSIKTILKVLKNKEILAIFPEGTRHKDLNSFADAKAGLGMFAIKGKANVVPISLITNYKLFNKVTLYIDKPVDLSEYYGSKLNTDDYQNISDNIMDIIKTNYFNNK